VESPLKIVFLSPLPPSRCGVASYAEEHLQHLKARGLEIVTISATPEGNADYRIDVTRVHHCWNFLRLILKLNHFQLIVHYADSYFFPLRMPETKWRSLCRLLQSLAFRWLTWKATRSEAIIHEVALSPTLPWTNTRPREFAFKGFSELCFHTTSLRKDFLSQFRSLSSARCQLIEHARFMNRIFQGNQLEAREHLGLPPSARVFLCIGFLHHAKGFHEALKAFEVATSSYKAPNSELHIVGSTQANDRLAQAYALELEAEATRCPQAHLHQLYLEKLDFDIWLCAADVLILPYLGVASSGVGARASLYETKIVMRNLPNLVDQFPDSETFESIEELCTLFIKHSSFGD
jgi:glycosyltransferase involved in cell wall biosynthesis